MDRISQLRQLEDSVYLNSLTEGKWITGLYTTAKMLGYYKGNMDEVYLLSPNYEGCIKANGYKLKISKPVTDFEYRHVGRVQTKESLFVGIVLREPFLVNTEYEICQRILWKEKNVNSFLNLVSEHIPKDIWDDNVDDLMEINNF